METLLNRITAQHRGTRNGTVRSGGCVTFRGDRGEVCSNVGRAAAHRDRVATAAHRSRL